MPSFFFYFLVSSNNFSLSPEFMQCLICSTCLLISILVPWIAKENFSHISQGETWGQTFFEERKLFRMKKVTGQTLAKLGSGSMVPFYPTTSSFWEISGKYKYTNEYQTMIRFSCTNLCSFVCYPYDNQLSYADGNKRGWMISCNSWEEKHCRYI